MARLRRWGRRPTTSFTNTGLTASTTYRYQVRATDAAGNVSAVSNTVTARHRAGGGTGGACSITPTTQTQWQTGYVIDPARVTNTGTATINGWTVTFTLPAGHTIADSGTPCSPSTVRPSRRETCRINGTLAPGANGTFGFQVSRPNGNTQLPSGYTCASP